MLTMKLFTLIFNFNVTTYIKNIPKFPTKNTIQKIIKSKDIWKKYKVYKIYQRYILYLKKTNNNVRKRIMQLVTLNTTTM